VRFQHLQAMFSPSILIQPFFRIKEKYYSEVALLEIKQTRKTLMLTSTNNSNVLVWLEINPSFSVFTSVKSHSVRSGTAMTCAAPCHFLADVACHYVLLCRSLIPFPPPSLLFPQFCDWRVNLRSRSLHIHFPLVAFIVINSLCSRVVPRTLIRLVLLLLPLGARACLRRLF